jgi:hypothetical protein
VRYPVPDDLSRQIADRAARYCRENLAGRGWSDRSTGAVQPAGRAGEVGLRTTAGHLMYQNSGIRPFLMRWVEGRVVPMGCSQGDGPHFRRGGHVGEPGWVDIPHVIGPGPGGKTWRDQRWRYPGLEPKRFFEDSISRAVRDSRPEIRRYIVGMMRGTR